MFKTKNPIKIDRDYKVPLKFDIPTLNMFIGYMFKKSVQVTRRSLSNMKDLFDLIDEGVYEGNESLEARFMFIKKALEAKVVKGFENDEAIISYCKTDVDSTENNEIIKNIPVYTRINYEEMKYINKVIEDRLRYAYLYYYKDALYESIEKLDSGSYKSFSEINDELTKICNDIIISARKSKSVQNTDTFSLSDVNFEETVTDIVTKLRNPSNTISTGIRKLNEILSPGFISGRLYVFLALPGIYKSAMLLKILRDTKKFNKGLVAKKPGKRPTALLITMENSVSESLERLFNMVSSKSEPMKDFTPKQVLKYFNESGEMSITEKDNVDLAIKYFPNRSISTADLYTIINDMSDNGQEVVILILDYLKRIRPAEKAKDEKEELKNVTNELKSLAEEYDIAVVSAQQLNRAGNMAIDAAMQSNKDDVTRFLGRSNVGTAFEIIENADWVSIINVERKRSTGQMYLTFKRLKIRYRALGDSDYFNHPFKDNNKMKLIDDVDMENSVSEDSLAESFDGVDFNSSSARRTVTKRDDNDDIFDFTKSINKKN